MELSQADQTHPDTPFISSEPVMPMEYNQVDQIR
jgi:hypothetical protein